uniref:Akirin-2 n=1 Tax=Lates calcarifer TaxID=8187 RepID=A0A4W6E224_LATCA
MACGATLKRTLDFDPLMSPASPKRRRCAAIMSPYSCAMLLPSYLPCLKMSQILHNIKQEYKRLQKRRHLDSAFQQADGCCPLDLQNIPSGSVLPGSYKCLIFMKLLTDFLQIKFSIAELNTFSWRMVRIFFFLENPRTIANPFRKTPLSYHFLFIMEIFFF